MLDRPIQWFVSEGPPTVVSRRATKAEQPDSLDVLVDSFARDVEQLIELKALKPRERDEQQPRAPKNLREAEELAQVVRGELGQPGGAVTDLVGAAEHLGLYVFCGDLPQHLPDGAYVALEGTGATVINGSQDAGRRRFSFAHELGHHIIGDEFSTDWAVADSRDEREKRINAFAIHFLMPRSSVARDWEAYGGDQEPRSTAIRLAAEYRVSWTAACTQLQNLKAIDGKLADTLRSQRPTRADFLEQGLFVTEELIAPALSVGFIQAALRAYRSQKIGASRAVELLRGTIAEDELPLVDTVPLEALRGELESPV